MRKIFILWDKKEQISKAKMKVMSILRNNDFIAIKGVMDIIVEDTIQIIFKKVSQRSVDTINKQCENSNSLFICDMTSETLPLLEKITNKTITMEDYIYFLSFNVLEKLLKQILIEEFNPKQVFTFDGLTLDSIERVPIEELSNHKLKHIFLSERSAYKWLEDYWRKTLKINKDKIAELTKIVYDANKKIGKFRSLVENTEITHLNEKIDYLYQFNDEDFGYEKGTIEYTPIMLDHTNDYSDEYIKNICLEIAHTSNSPLSRYEIVQMLCSKYGFKC